MEGCIRRQPRKIHGDVDAPTSPQKSVGPKSVRSLAMGLAMMACVAACSGFSQIHMRDPAARLPLRLIRHAEKHLGGLLGPSLLQTGGESGGLKRVGILGLSMESGARGEVASRGHSRGGRGGGRVKPQERHDPVLIKDLGHCNGTVLQLMDSGSGPYVSWGRVNSPLPAEWRDDLDSISSVMVQELLSQRMDACLVLRVVGLPMEITEGDIRDIFSEYSIPEGGVQFQMSREGTFHGQVFLKFARSSEATACMEEFGGCTVGGREIRIFKQLSGGPFKYILLLLLLLPHPQRHPVADVYLTGRNRTRGSRSVRTTRR